MFSSKNIQFFAYLSIAAAVSTIGIKAAAYLVSGSMGLLSDAIESFVNLASSLITLYTIKFAMLPGDERHQFGHTKIEYFSALAQGLFIFVAGASIVLSSAWHLLQPPPMEHISLGAALAFGASLINAFVSYHLFAAGKKYNSVALQGEAHHLLSDVYTSGAVILGVTLAYLFNIPWLDPLCAIILGLQVLKTSFSLLYTAFHGLMDEALTPEQSQQVQHLLEQIFTQSAAHAHLPFVLKSRQSGQKKFLYLTFATPDHWSVKQAHDLCLLIEQRLYAWDPAVECFIHTEPHSHFLHVHPAAP